MEIKKLNVKNRIFLAPMADVNDIAFRILCQRAGAGLVYTGMINPLTRQRLDLDDKPALQLFSSNDKGIKEFMKKHDSKVRLWDFNLGCPALKARKNKVGSFLNELKMIEKILKAMRMSTEKPVTVKIRKSAQALKILNLSEKYCDALCIHPRMNSQGYSGEVDLKFALKLKKKAKIPIIYSGDVHKANVGELLEKFDYVMIGRKAIGNPGIFSELTGLKNKFAFSDYLKLARKYNLKFSQIKHQAMNFTSGMNEAKKLRFKLEKVKKLEEIREIFK